MNFSIPTSTLPNSSPRNDHLTWKDLLREEKKEEYFKTILQFVEQERAAGKTIYPKNSEIFSSLALTEFHKVKVVILGQDPYHGQNQAHGLAFSVKPGVPVPPSLKNIFEELKIDVGIRPPSDGFLEPWAKQGVLLLNTVLTVQAGKPESHKGMGWEQFTDKIVSLLAERRSNLVFLLWGSHAQKKGSIVNPKQHLILKAPHPSPLSAHRGFLGCKHFSKTNEYLAAHDEEPIDWNVG